MFGRKRWKKTKLICLSKFKIEIITYYISKEKIGV